MRQHTSLVKKFLASTIADLLDGVETVAGWKFEAEVVAENQISVRQFGAGNPLPSKFLITIREVRK